MYTLTTVQGDVLDFVILLKDGCQEITLSEGDQYFFLTDPDLQGRMISITQTDPHFHVASVTLSPGSYPFRAGVLYANGERLTVFPSEQNNLYVGRP